jgi:zinc transport system substrate-binding protein
LARRSLWLPTSIAVLALLLASCSSNEGASSPGSTTVVAAFYPIQEAAGRVGGGAVEVFNLTPPGAEPHDLELTPDGVERVQSADVVLYLGGGFQPALEDALSGAEGETVDLLAGLDTLPPPPGEAAEGLSVDPHIWLAPRLYAEMVSEVAEALAKADPDSASTFRANAKAFEAEIDQVDLQYQEGLAHCQRHIIVTSHEAFGYLASAYGLTQEAITGLSPEAEPGPARLAELKDLVQRQGITTIFTEELVSPKVAQTLAQEAGVQTKVLSTIEGLTPEEEAAGADYISLMLDNLATLEEALDCS